MPSIDLNCDLGEGAGHDAELMPLITSANIACGAHAGDLATMRATLALAQKFGVAAGAHPGFADRKNFGRTELPLSPDDVRPLVAAQIEALRALGTLRHVKAHGALYNMAARDAALADALARAVAVFDRSLMLFAPPDSQMVHAGRALGLRVVTEAFADRAYEPDGRLVPRSRPGAVIDDAGVVAARAVRLATDRTVAAIDGSLIICEADTLCVHSDTPRADAIAAAIRAGLQAAGVTIMPAGRA
jgi:UPF0271 protein